MIGARDGGRGSPVDWKLGHYILDDAHGGEKVAWAHATNCQSDDLGTAVTEIIATQERNRTSQIDKSYHLVVSFPVGERPTREQMEDIERELCDAIGFGEHQRVAAVHQNTDNWHMHIAINRVHPTTLRAIEPHRDHFKLQEACAELEIKHGLTVTRHTPSPERAHAKAAELEAHTGRMSFARWVAEHAAVPLKARSAEAKTWADLHAAMADYGLVIKPRGAGLIVSNADGTVRMKASAIDRALSFKALTDRFGAYEPPGTPAREPIMQYTGMPRGADPSLWERYRREREQAEAARSAWLTPEAEIPRASPARAKLPYSITALNTLTPASRRPSSDMDTPASKSADKRLSAISAERGIPFTPVDWYGSVWYMGDPRILVPGVDYPRTFQEVDEWFRSDAACHEYIRRLRWPDGFICPGCQWTGEPRVTLRGLFQCRSCQRQTSVTAGTIFQDTRKPLRTWFMAMWYVINQKNGVSALGLQRVLGFSSYETAWTWLHKLRRAMVRPGVTAQPRFGRRLEG